MVRRAYRLQEELTAETEGTPGLVQLVKEVFQIPEGKRGLGSIIAWWEIRRWPYNLLVGMTVAICLLLALFLESQLGDRLVEKVLGPARDPDDWGLNPVTGIAYAIVGNIFYTLGWISELFVWSIFRERVRWFGPVAFGLGLLLTLFVCTLSVFELGTMWLLHLVRLVP